MSRKLAAAVTELTEEQRERIRLAAEENGFEIRFISNPDREKDFLLEAEVVFGHLPRIARESTKLKWICTPYAGVDQFLAPDAFANPDALLTNSSGAYDRYLVHKLLLFILLYTYFYAHF